MIHQRPLSLFLLTALSLLGCEGTTDGSSITGGGRAPSTVNEADAAPGDNLDLPGGSAELPPDQQQTGTDLLPNGDECEAIRVNAKALPVDVFIMLDQSVSMDEKTEGFDTRWEAVTTAIEDFVGNDAAEGIGVGIQYFGQQAVDDCSPDKYASADVEIDLLPDVADAITASLARAQGPFSKTPTYPALEGALMHAKQHAATVPDRQTIVALVSDGFPTECEQSPVAIADLAKAALSEEPKVITSVVAIEAGGQNAATIARAGGGEAFVIQPGSNVADYFLDALLTLSSERIGCSFEIPEHEAENDEVIDFDRVAVTYKSASGRVIQVPKVSGQSRCAPEGWYTDSPTDPTLLHVCPATCQEFGAGSLAIRFGCKEILEDPSVK